MSMNSGRWALDGVKDSRCGKAPEEELKEGILVSDLGQDLFPFHWLRSAQSFLMWLLSCLHQPAMNSVPLLQKTALDMDHSYSPVLLAGSSLSVKDQRHLGPSKRKGPVSLLGEGLTSGQARCLSQGCWSFLTGRTVEPVKCPLG